MYQKHSHVTNLKSALSDVLPSLIMVLIKGWDKWSLMGHPVTKSSPYGSDYLIKKVYADHDCPTFSTLFPPIVHTVLIDRTRCAHQFEWWDGQYYQIVALEQTFVCFCIDKMTLNFAVKTIQLNVNFWH